MRRIELQTGRFCAEIKEIANCLEIKVKAVDNHRQNLMDKLRVHSIEDLTRYALKEGFLKAD